MGSRRRLPIVRRGGGRTELTGAGPEAPRHRTVVANGISLHVAEAGSGPPVILAHGFPELWYSWRHQIGVLAKAGYRVLAPDMRGYGGTERPSDVAAYDIDRLAGDLVGLLDDVGEDRAVFVGHDWGAPVVWHVALAHPERARGVVGMSVPFVPRPGLSPTRLLRAWAGERFFYMLYFQAPGVADAELARDPRETLTRVLWSASGEAPREAFTVVPRVGHGWLDTMSPMPALPPWLSEEDLRVYVDAFARTGFTGGLNWYRNLDRNWELTKERARATVRTPALFVAGARDAVLRMTPPEVMDGWVEDLRGSMVIPGAGHWVQQERPDEVNRALLGFLAGLG
jgi:pimeloyl-ACP methyl ester carboxylesterase